MHDAEEYDRQKKLTEQTSYKNPVVRLIDGMKWYDHEVLLDYGCAGGRVTHENLLPLATKYDSFIHSVDNTLSMIEYAKKTYPSPRAEYQVANVMVDAFPFVEKYFDKIFAIHVLNWIQDLEVCFERFFNLLKPGGYFGFVVGCGGYFQNKLLKLAAEDQKWAPFMQGSEEFDYMNMYDHSELVEETYRNIASKVGFQIVQLDKVEEGEEPVSMERLVSFYVSLNPYLERIPITLRPELEKDYNKYINQLIATNAEKKGEDLVSHRHQFFVGIFQRF